MIAVLYIAHGRTGIEVTVEVIGADALHESINVAVDRALTGYIRNCIQVQQQPDAVSARQGHADVRRILPTGQSPLSRSYDGAAGVADTAEEVRALRQRGIRVAAVFMGENASVPDARTIYGHDLVRIQRIDQLAAAAGKLIQEEIRELSG